jgi:hypothetical protein
VASNTGANPEKDCVSMVQIWKDKLIAGKRVVVLLPVFDKDNGLTGDNAKFYLKAFAAIDLFGWDLANQDPFQYMPATVTSYRAAGGYKPSDRGVIGKFIRYVALDEEFESGGSTDYGGTVVELTK